MVRTSHRQSAAAEDNKQEVSREGGLWAAFGGTRLSLSLEPGEGERRVEGAAASSRAIPGRDARW